jgi:hypothetical protein
VLDTLEIQRAIRDLAEEESVAKRVVATKKKGSAGAAATLPTLAPREEDVSTIDATEERSRDPAAYYEMKIYIGGKAGQFALSTVTQLDTGCPSLNLGRQSLFDTLRENKACTWGRCSMQMRGLAATTCSTNYFSANWIARKEDNIGHVGEEKRGTSYFYVVPDEAMQCPLLFGGATIRANNMLENYFPYDSPASDEKVGDSEHISAMKQAHSFGGKPNNPTLSKQQVVMAIRHEVSVEKRRDEEEREKEESIPSGERVQEEMETEEWQVHE